MGASPNDRFAESISKAMMEESLAQQNQAN
jgi:hypothetical protein